MNLQNLKKASRIDKKIVYRKLKNKLLNSIIDKFYRLRDSHLSTYSYDYTSYLRLASDVKVDLKVLFHIDITDEENTDFVEKCIKHEHKILSSKFVNINSIQKYDSLQQNFNKRLIPFTTLAFNKIADDYILINWQKDFNKDFEWNYAWYKDIRFGNNTGSDIKVPWELGRLQHLPWLALSYSETKKEKVKTEIRNQIFDFIASNPPNFGVQWMSSMDIGIRLVNILFTISFFDESNKLFKNDEMELINSYLFDHYQHIRDNIEYSDGMRGNHYLSNLCSILVYSCFIEDNASKDLLIEKYINLINIELDYQFHPDGSNFEASTRYHIFTNQMVITANIILSKLTGKTLNIIKLNLINSFTAELLKFSQPVQIGDNDSGFYWKVLDNENITYKSLKGLTNSEKNSFASANYLNFGYISKKSEDFNLIFKCGKVGQMGKGGHDHNDNLSYNLYYKGSALVTDIGTYCYTSNFEKRNYYRSTLQHNVLTINNEEQNAINNTSKDDMFWLETINSNPKILENETDIIKGSINYCGKEYVREIQMNSNEILITDKYLNKLDKEIRIHLHPNITIQSMDKNVYKLLIKSEIILLDTFNNNSKIEAYNFSPEYGVEVESQRIIINSKDDVITHKYFIEQ